MIGLNITVTGADKAIDETGREIDNLIGRFAERISFHFSRIMGSGTRHGRLYRKGRFKARQSRGLGVRARGPGTRIHRASAPGEPLASDTGRTANSVTVRRLKSGVYRVRFGGAAGFWEVRGDKSRPTLLPAIQAAADEIFA